MENTESIERQIEAILSDKTKTLQVTERTREILAIIAKYDVVLGDFLLWLEKHYNGSDKTTDEACEALRPCREYLQTWLLHSIAENTAGLPFEGI